jgi:hypothetical protein
MIKILPYAATILGMLILPALSETPDLFRIKEFNSKMLADAANYYISLGEDRAIKELKALEGRASIGGVSFDRNPRIGWVCRIIFKGAQGEPLREPGLGGLSLPHLTMPIERWPLYPVADSDGVFFVLDERYRVAGWPERLSDYIDYCHNKGEFRKTYLKVPTQDMATKAFLALKESERWKLIKWKDEAIGIKYTFSEEWVLKYIENQTKEIPKLEAEQAAPRNR